MAISPNRTRVLTVAGERLTGGGSCRSRMRRRHAPGFRLAASGLSVCDRTGYPPVRRRAKIPGLVALAVHPLAQKLAVPANGLGLFTGLALGRLLVGTAQLHFPEHAFALHLLLERFQRLIDVVIAYDYVNDDTASYGCRLTLSKMIRLRSGLCRSARLIT